MAAVATLTSLSGRVFAGLSHIYENAEKVGSLAYKLNTLISKINEVIGAREELDTLAVGDSATYYLGGHSWLLIDGVNPPIVSKLMMQDQVTGGFVTVSVESGSVVVS
jgi:hypothetical protein